MFIRKFGLLAALAVFLTGFTQQQAAAQNPQQWNDIRAEAKGQTVYWNAWGGSERINTYISWVGKRVLKDYGVTLKQVKVTDTADVVSRVLAEKIAGKHEGGSVDLIWINGENFASMKKSNLLFGPFTAKLPNYQFVDVENKATVTMDFTIPVEGLEAPWGMAKFNFIYDSARVKATPNSIPEMLKWAENHTGRFTYPSPPDYLGSTFLKQALVELTDTPALLRSAIKDPAIFEAATKPLWDFLNKLHPPEPVARRAPIPCEQFGPATASR